MCTDFLLRLPLSAVFLHHGITKFPMAAEVAKMLGVSTFAVYGLGFCEVLAAVCVLVGGFQGQRRTMLTRVGTSIIGCVMIGAIWMVHWGQWSFMPSTSHPTGGIEFHMVLLGIAAYLFATTNQRA